MLAEGALRQVVLTGGLEHRLRSERSELLAELLHRPVDVRHSGEGLEMSGLDLARNGPGEHRVEKPERLVVGPAVMRAPHVARGRREQPVEGGRAQQTAMGADRAQRRQEDDATGPRSSTRSSASAARSEVAWPTSAQVKGREPGTCFLIWSASSCRGAL